MELKIIRDYEITLYCSIFIYVSCDCSIIFILYCEIGENKNVGIYRKKSWWVRWETRAETSFRHAYTTEIASRVRQPDTNLRMNHAQVYVNRTRPKYTYTPGAFTSSFERRFPHFRCTPPLFRRLSPSCCTCTYLLDTRGYFEILYHSTNLTFLGH